MAEERNTGLTAGQNAGIARAPQTDAATTTTNTSGASAPDDTEATKQELQRRMEAAREHISQTVSEIKDTVTTQYESVRTSINENLDWREHVRKRPTSFSIAAGTVGFFLGMAVGGAFGGRSSSDDKYDYSDYEYDEDDDTYSPTSTARAYRAQSMSGANSYDSTSDYGDSSSSRSKSYRASSSSYSSAAPSSSYNTLDESEPSGPGLFERFKGTAAFDKLSNEISTLGNRVVDELSHTAQTVVLPMVLGKLKDAVGIDLGTQKRVSERSRIERETSEAQAEAINSTKEANQRASEHDDRLST